MTDETPTIPERADVDERVDPLERLSPFTVDHLARYYIASQVVQGKEVLDAACGIGFGARILAEAGAAKVTAADLDIETVEDAHARYDHPAINYLAADLEKGEWIHEGPWDVICSFETLEHLREPKVFVQRLRKALKDDGLLLLSVPGEVDQDRDNPFHFQHFTKASLEELIGSEFAQVHVIEQRFSIAAEFQSDGQVATTSTTIPFPSEGDTPAIDGYLVIAGSEIPDTFRKSHLWHLPAVWQTLESERLDLYRQCEIAHSGYHKAHAELSDLKQRFTTMLAWGKAHFKANTGKDDHGDKQIESLQAQVYEKNNALNAELAEAKGTIAKLEAELAELKSLNDESSTFQQRLRSVLEAST